MPVSPARPPSLAARAAVRQLLTLSALLGIVAWMYWPVRGFEYVWDDVYLFLTTNRLREVDDFWRTIGTPFLPGASYFRPIVIASFIGEFRLFDVSPAASHSINLAILLLNIALLYLLARRVLSAMFDGRALELRTLLATALYGLHVALIEPAAWVSGRFDLLLTTFCLLACLLALRRPAVGWVSGLACCAAFLLAAGCKETAALLPAAIFALHWIDANPAAMAPLQRRLLSALRPSHANDRRSLWLYAGLIATGMLYLLIRFEFMSTDLRLDSALHARLDSAWAHGGFVGQTIGFYLRLIVFPFADISLINPVDVTELSFADHAKGWAHVLAALGLVAWSLLRPAPWRILLVVALMFLFPVLNVLPLAIGGSIGHARFLTLPLVFVALAVASLRLPLLGDRFARLEQLRRPFGVALLLAWFGLSIANIRVTLPLWSNGLSLWAWAFERYPDDGNAQAGLISSALQYRRFDMAKKAVDRIEGKQWVPAKLDVLMGMYLVRVGQYDKAIERVELGLKTVQQPHRIAEQQGIDINEAHLDINKYDDALMLAQAYNTLAEAANSLRKFDDARRYAGIALFYQRDFPPAWMARTFAEYGQGKPDDAARSMEAALRLYTKEVRPDMLDLRLQFLRQLCDFPQAPRPTCDAPEVRTLLSAPRPSAAAETARN